MVDRLVAEVTSEAAEVTSKAAEVTFKVVSNVEDRIWVADAEAMEILWASRTKNEAICSLIGSTRQT